MSEQKPEQNYRQKNTSNRFFFSASSNSGNQQNIQFGIGQKQQQQPYPYYNRQKNKNDYDRKGPKRNPYFDYSNQNQQRTVSGPQIKVEIPRSTTPTVSLDKRRNDLEVKDQSLPHSNSSQIRIEINSSVPRSSSGDLKIKVERNQNENKAVILAGSSQGELCPFCGGISLPFYDLMGHIINVHKLLGILEETMRSSKNPEMCSKCNEVISNSHFVMHCIHAHEYAVLEMFRDRCLDMFPKRRDEIEAFIQTHAPHLNPKYKRTFDISSSSDSSDSEPLEVPQDEEYTAFIASSINSDGLEVNKSTKPAEKKLKFDPSKFESRNDFASTSTKEYIEQLAIYETFLRDNNLITYDQSHFQCKICNKKFNCVIHLVDHCNRLHRLKVTPEIRRALCIMNSQVTNEMSERELMKIPNLYLGLTLYPILKARPEASPKYAMDVPAIYIDFLLETLSVTQPIVDPFHTPKRFTQPMPIMVRLPTPLPIIFSPSKQPNHVTLGFFDTPIILASDIQTIVTNTLNNLAFTEIFEAKFTNVDSECGFTDDQLLELSEKLEVDLLKTEDKHEINEKTRSFSIIMLKNQWTPSKTQAVQSALKELLDEAYLHLCKKCHDPFNSKTGGDCVGPKASGLLIKVKGGVHEADREISGCECRSLLLKNLEL